MSQPPTPITISFTDGDNLPKKGNRGLSWSVEEDEQLCRSWANINIGGETTTLSMWDRIKDDFHVDITPRTPRSVSAMRSRWHVIQGCTLKFCEAVAEAETQITNSDAAENGNLVLTEAFKIYRANSKFNEGFTLQHCWTVLRDKPKWKSVLAKRATRNAKNAMMARLAADSSLNNSIQANSTLANSTMVISTPTSSNIPQTAQQPQQIQPQMQPQIQPQPQVQQPQVQQQQQTQVQHPPQVQLQPQVQQQPSSSSCEMIVATPPKRKSNSYDNLFDNNKKLRLKERKLDLKIMAINPLDFNDPIRREFFQLQQKEVLYRWKKALEQDEIIS